MSLAGFCSVRRRLKAKSRQGKGVEQKGIHERGRNRTTARRTIPNNLQRANSTGCALSVRESDKKEETGKVCNIEFDSE
jgi:hypothetical protein